MPRYRQGSKVPINVYDGDEPIFQAHDAASAMKLVGLLNMGWHLTQVTYDQLQDVFAESERYWGEEDFLTRLQSEVWMLLMPKNVVVSAPETPPGSPVSEIEPGEPQDTAEAAEGALSILRRLQTRDPNWEWEIEEPPKSEIPHWVRVDRTSRSWEYFEALTDAEQAAWKLVDP